MKIAKENAKGISLVALVVTIIVLLILSGVTINLVFSEKGIIARASESKMATEFGKYKEEYNLFIIDRKTANLEFDPNSINAGETNLYYNTKTEENGNIYTVLPSLKDSKYKEKIEIIKGEILLNSKDKNEIKFAQNIGVKINPYDMVNGELVSSNGNLLLVDKSGTLTIPDSVTKIGDGAFAELKEDPELPSLKTVIIPGSVKEIGNNAFRGNSSIEKVIIQDGVETIGSRAFYKCTNLQEIYMPDSVTNIGNNCFRSCINLNKVRLSENIASLPESIFHLCHNLKSIDLPINLKYIESYSLYSSGIESIKIPSTVEYIGDTAFSSCKNLKQIDVSSNKNFIFEDGMLYPSSKKCILFISDAKLKASDRLVIPEGIDQFNNHIIGYTNIKTLVLPNSLTGIKVEGIPESINNIEMQEDNPNFMIYNKGLYSKDGKKLVISFDKGTEISNLYPGVEIISERAFYSSSNAKNIILPESAARIEQLAFSSYSTTKITIGKNVNYISPLFRGWGPRNVELIIDPLNKNYYVEGECLYKNRVNKELVTILNNKQGKFIIDSSIKIIGKLALFQQNLDEIVIEEGVEEIKGQCFGSMEKLKNIIIPSSVKYIENNAFADSSVEKILINKTKDSIPGAPWGATKGLKVVEWKK